MLNCSVTRTHHMGEPLKDREYGSPVAGSIKMYSTPHKGLNRTVRVMTLDSMQQFGATTRSAIPDLLEPELLTFGSDRGMMVIGFEEVGGCRYYQGWWIQWAI